MLSCDKYNQLTQNVDDLAWQMANMAQAERFFILY